MMVITDVPRDRMEMGFVAPVFHVGEVSCIGSFV